MKGTKREGSHIMDDSNRNVAGLLGRMRRRLVSGKGLAKDAELLFLGLVGYLLPRPLPFLARRDFVVVLAI